MRYVKNTILAACLIILPIGNIYAIARAPLEGGTLQPMPNNVQPAISNNINSDLSPVPAETQTAGATTQTASDTPNNSENDDSAIWIPIIAAIFAISVAVLLFHRFN